ncbi:sucrose-6-phosphate hydrolase [Vibrio ishigakensis]|uniref:Sucrose-6-phosphate hydrolase n=1 Tax=Vibrio ishigakensis TaxID=1481914 RepID=A0A0B8NU94_9VIBR|nr:sucrose-6-phosphate hydrolase [Vibrio ishigakensis]
MLEKYRPHLHMTPDSGWMNDPNGLVYFGGQYHQFYQYYPQDTVWGPMHWDIR